MRRARMTFPTIISEFKSASHRKHPKRAAIGNMFNRKSGDMKYGMKYGEIWGHNTHFARNWYYVPILKAIKKQTEHYT
jgi:hypothetical protein